MGEEFLGLPFVVQVSLGSGYLAYLLAYAGIRQHHSATDTIFISAAFGLIAAAILKWGQFSTGWDLGAAILATILAGLFWRWRGRRWSRSLLRTTNVSWTDDIPSAWLSIVAERTDTPVSQIAVDLDDGRTLTCDDTRQFKDAPFGPCILGLDGSVALYVSAERKPDGSWIEHENIRDPHDGDRITFIPAGAIRRVELRLWRKASARDATAVVPTEALGAEPAASAVELNLECKSAADPQQIP